MRYMLHDGFKQGVTNFSKQNPIFPQNESIHLDQTTIFTFSTLNMLGLIDTNILWENVNILSIQVEQK